MSSLVVQRVGWQGTNGLPVGRREPLPPSLLGLSRPAEAPREPAALPSLSTNSAFLSCSASLSPLPSPLLCLWVFDFLFENSSSLCHCRSPSPCHQQRLFRACESEPSTGFY